MHLKFNVGGYTEPNAAGLRAIEPYDLDPHGDDARELEFHLPDDGWTRVVILGESASGKTQAITHRWPNDHRTLPELRPGVSVIDQLCEILDPEAAPRSLQAAGLNSIPAWLRPPERLSAGELYRSRLALRLLYLTPRVVIDDFGAGLSEDLAARIATTLARHSEENERQIIIATQSEAIAAAFDPDWTVTMPDGKPHRRGFLQRPHQEIGLHRAPRTAWEALSQHHYLTAQLNPCARLYGAWHGGKCIGIVATIPFAHPAMKAQREHRLVIHPDWQGFGVGHWMSSQIAAWWTHEQRAYYSLTAHPRMIARRDASHLWLRVRKHGRLKTAQAGKWGRANSCKRTTSSHRYVGPPAEPPDWFLMTQRAIDECWQRHEVAYLETEAKRRRQRQ